MKVADIPESKPLQGRLAVLTGATGALGRCLAQALIEAGASLVACHRRDLSGDAAGWLDALRQCAVQPGQRLARVQADLCRAEGIDRAFEVAARLGGCDILVNSASALLRRRFEETDRAELEALVALNVTAPMACCQAAIAQMRGKARGDIVNIIDVGGGCLPWRRGAAYCATRAAIAMLTRCLALELGPHIRVNALAPGLIDLSREVQAHSCDAALCNIPMGRPATSAEVVAGFLFLLTGPAAMSGQILAVDGGRSARGPSAR